MQHVKIEISQKLQHQSSERNLPPQLNWFPLRYLNLAASLTICKPKLVNYLLKEALTKPSHVKGACLVKSRKNVICELDFCYGSIALPCKIYKQFKLRHMKQNSLYQTAVRFDGKTRSKVLNLLDLPQLLDQCQSQRYPVSQHFSIKLSNQCLGNNTNYRNNYKDTQ